MVPFVLMGTSSIFEEKKKNQSVDENETETY